jgi:hypothetical protein
MKEEKNYNISTQDVIASIKSVDEKLSLAKDGYNDAPINKKNKWMDTINRLLEDRSSLMKIRDEYCN